MRARFVRVWDELWTHVWSELAEHEEAPSDLFCELYRELARILREVPTVEQVADVVGDIDRSVQVFQQTRANDLSGEWAIVEFLEASHDVLEDCGGAGLSKQYQRLLSQFIDKFNLGYDLSPPCRISPTVPGMFASLVDAIRSVVGNDDHLRGLYANFEDSIRAVRMEETDNNIRTCVVKQINLLEAIACQHPRATRNTIGAICREVETWPHDGVRDAMMSLYKFACDYPGIRHSGTASAAARSIDMRDMLALSILLMGFVPYLSEDLDASQVYRGLDHTSARPGDERPELTLGDA